MTMKRHLNGLSIFRERFAHGIGRKECCSGAENLPCTFQALFSASPEKFTLDSWELRSTVHLGADLQDWCYHIENYIEHLFN